MREYLPLILVGAVIGAFTVVFSLAYLALRRRTAGEAGERHMEDGELIRRMARYAAPHWKSFALILVIMLISVLYDVLSPRCWWARSRTP